MTKLAHLLAGLNLPLWAIALPVLVITRGSS